MNIPETARVLVMPLCSTDGKDEYECYDDTQSIAVVYDALENVEDVPRIVENMI